MALSWNWVLIVAGALLTLVEIAFGGFAGFDLVLIGSAFVIGGGLGLVLHNATLGFITASVLCVGYIVLGRRWVRARIQPRHAATNVDALIGKQGVVIQRIAPHAPGQVRVNDEIWRAESAPDLQSPLEPGALVTVSGVSGVTLQVR